MTIPLKNLLLEHLLPSFYADVVAELAHQSDQDWVLVFVNDNSHSAAHDQCIMSYDGRVIHFGFNPQTQRVVVSGQWPYAEGELVAPDYKFVTKRPEITVSPHRKPEQIVRDIRRRFMPDFWKHWDEMSIDISKNNTKNVNRTSALNTLRGKIIGASDSQVSRDRIHVPFPYNLIRVNHDGSEAELWIGYIPMAWAHEIIDLVENYRNKLEEKGGNHANTK